MIKWKIRGVNNFRFCRSLRIYLNKSIARDYRYKTDRKEEKVPAVSHFQKIPSVKASEKFIVELSLPKVTLLLFS